MARSLLLSLITSKNTGFCGGNSIFGVTERKRSRIKAEREDMAGGKKTPEIEEELLSGFHSLSTALTRKSPT
jgi:hypothetical protein